MHLLFPFSKKLNSEAEANLRTMVKIYAQCDGQPVSATIDQFSPNHSGRTADGAFLLEKGKSYDLHLTHQKDGNTYEGSLSFTAGWNGLQQKTVSLKNSFSGTIALPGNVQLEMVKIQAGSFQMGSPGSEEDRNNDETLHWVTLTQDYWLGKYEVTQEQYEAVMKDNQSCFNEGGRYPVEEVSWDDAVKFCGELNRLMKGKLPPGYEFNLPTEAQWEYAARGGNKSRHYVYSGSNDCGSVAWYLDNSDFLTHPVGQKQPNELGLYDMSGNVWEWCRDWYASYYPSGNLTDPAGPTSGTFRVNRGGGWNGGARSCRSAGRDCSGPSCCGNLLGFRLALVPVRSGLTEKTVQMTKTTSSGTISLPGNVQLEMVKIQAGSFQMGSPGSEKGRFRHETLHGVTLTQDYWLGKYEVTQEQYEAVMKDNPSDFKKGGRYPVENVSWDDAVKFCGELNRLMEGKLPPGYEFNLPTEAQWEYAARGGNKSRHYVYSGSNDCGSVAWYCDNSVISTHPVGQKLPNELGLYDMSGNVNEWCRDWYASYPSGNLTDPAGPTSGTLRVNRGGGWYYRARGCRSANRNSFVPSYCTYGLGFRLALVPVQ